ncbi:MAG: hypothetical protein ABL949_10875 [Fimbriimonadaceae bacterium]
MATAGLGNALSVKAVGAAVYVNEQHVLTLKAGRNEERAQVVANSFRKIAAGATLFLKKRDKNTYEIFEGERVVLTVTKAESVAQDSSAADLAGLWLGRLRAALALPALTLSDTSVRVGLDGKATVKLEGYLAAKAVVTIQDSDLVSLTRSANELSIVGRQLGQTTITATVGSVSKSARVSVLPVATKFPQTLTISVTGDPANGDTIKSAVEGAMWTRFEVLDSAAYEFAVPAIPGLGFSQHTTIPVSVTASAPNALPAKGVVNVIVKNESISYRAESELWYSNHPENVQQPGNLFGASLRNGEAVRMLYHHINDSPAGIVLMVQAVNPTMQPARLLIIPGDSKPDKNPVLAGIVAAEQLLKSWVKFSGEVVTIPPMSSIPISMRRLAPQETASGLCYLRLIDGPAEITVRTDAAASSPADGRSALAMQTTMPWQRLGAAPLDARLGIAAKSPFVYPWPFKTQSVDYSVGGRHAFVRIGQVPISTVNGEGLDGNFGVFYSIEANCANPGSESADLEVVFEASAGYSGALFVLNGEVKRTPLLQPKEEVLVAKIKLAAGEKRRFALMTVPLSGSSYPATIVIRPVGSGSSSMPMRQMYGSSTKQ